MTMRYLSIRQEMIYGEIQLYNYNCVRYDSIKPYV